MFVDTSVLAYVFDSTDNERRGKAKALVESVFLGKNKATVSNQVLGELANILITKKHFKAEPKEALAFIQYLETSKNWRKVNYSTKTIQAALEISLETGLHLWDSVIAATMKENGETEITTDNWKDFQKIPWLKVKRL